MKNAEYWARRFEAMESDTHKAAQMTAAEIAEVYKQAEAACKKEVEAWYGRLAANNGVDIAAAKEMLSRQELKEFKWDVKQYIKAMEDNETSGAWVKELENASARYHISKYEGLMTRLMQQVEFAAAKEDGILTDSLKEAYSENFYRTCYEIQSGLKTGFEISAVNEKQINAAIKRPWAADNKAFSDRIWKRRDELVKKLDTEITQNIMLGRGVQDSAKAIAKDFNTTVNRAATLVYTETAHAASMAQKAGFEELGVEEFEIVATLDNVTSEICQEMDGKHLPMSEFKAGVTAPPFHPNCRSVTAPYFEDSEEIFGVTERAARDPETGKTVYVDDMTYPEWKKVYVDKTQTLDEWKAAKKGVAKSAESGISGKKRQRNSENYVDMEYINSDEYKKKFEVITDNKTVNQSIYKYAKAALEHRKNTNKEDLFIIDSINGKLVTSITDTKEDYGVNYSNKVERIIEKCRPKTLIALHNHPTNNPPTGSDFSSAGYRKYKFGVVICHDGTIYTYEVGNIPFSSKSFDSMVDSKRKSGYNEKEAIIETLGYFEEMYGIRWSDVK